MDIYNANDYRWCLGGLYLLPKLNTSVANYIYNTSFLDIPRRIYRQYFFIPCFWILISFFDIRYVVKCYMRNRENNRDVFGNVLPIVNIVIAVISILIHFETLKILFDGLMSVWFLRKCWLTSSYRNVKKEMTEN